MPTSRTGTSTPLFVVSRRSALAGYGLALAAAMLAGLPALAQHPNLPLSFTTTADQLHAQNHPECTCRAGGASFQLGTQICIGDQMVRCSMDLNVTSWKSVGSACPQS